MIPNSEHLLPKSINNGTKSLQGRRAQSSVLSRPIDGTCRGIIRLGTTHQPKMRQTSTTNSRSNIECYRHTNIWRIRCESIHHPKLFSIHSNQQSLIYKQQNSPTNRPAWLTHK